MEYNIPISDGDSLNVIWLGITKPRALFVAGIHGDEKTGTLTLKDLALLTI